MSGVPESPLFDDLAGAVLDGDAVDWAAEESSADADARPIVRGLRVIAAVADVHRDASPADGAPSALPWSTPSPERWGHLRIHERIGQGAFGEVFRAWDPRLDREVALKLLPAAVSPSPDDENSIIREGRLLARVRHPNVVTIYGAEQIGDRIGLWMEFVRGQTLEQELKTRGSFRSADVVGVGVEICRAVSAVHAAGLLHRDIKAQNVTRAEDGRIVLMDFGAGSELHTSSTANVAGTPLYAAPEVLAGHAATVQSDVYSLGVLLYHLLTGSYPVRGRTLRGVRDAHARGARIHIQSIRLGVRPRLARAIERACDPRPERRHPDADTLGRELLALQRRPSVIALRLGAAAAAVVAAVFIVSEAWARFSTEHRSLRSRLVGMIAGAPTPLAFPVIAVLPFKNLGSDASSDLLVDSVTTGLIRQLAIIDGLQVKSQASSFAFRKRPRDLRDVGKRLSVNLVVDGDARISGDTLVINASLLSVPDGVSIWSSKVDRQLRSESDLVRLIEELTRTIVNELRVKLAAPTQRRYDTDITTLQTYLKARALRDASGAYGREALALFEDVIRADPSYAPAKAALAAVYGSLALSYPNVEGYAIHPDEAARIMEPLTLSALELDPMLAEAHASRGFLHALANRWTEAEASFRQAIAVDPSYTSLHTDFVRSTLLPWGRVDESVSILETALETDPESLNLRRILTRVQLNGGLYQQALDNAQRVFNADPSFPVADNLLRWALLFNGERAEALDSFETFSVGRPGVRGYIHAINGRRREADEIAAKFAHLPQRQAEIYGLLGDKDRALEALERLAVVNHIRAATYLNHPEIGLRGDPRAAAFRKKLGFPW